MTTKPQTSPHRLVRPRRICCTGAGVNLTAPNASFAEQLGRQLAKEDGLIIVTGGFKHRVGSAENLSTDWQVTKGARDHLLATGVPEEGRIETLLPDADHDDTKNTRFQAGRVVRLHNRSPQARRFWMVSGSDAVCTIQGHRGTRQIIDMALAIERPVLPLPFTGGESRRAWEANRPQICEWFSIDNQTVEELKTELNSIDQARVQTLAATVCQLLLRRLKRKCLIMMPFAQNQLPLYEKSIRPAVQAQGLAPVRSDRLNLVGNAIEVLRTAINNCDCCLAVLTGFNPNVMYELGLAHALGKPVVLLCEFQPGSRALPELPFDVRSEYVMGYEADHDETRGDIGAVLSQLYHGSA